MNYTITYHALVVREDIPAIVAVWRKKIQRVIKVRLAIEPDLYGKPLRRSLDGHRKLRVVDYRVVFRIEREWVKIFAIIHRSCVFDEAEKRI